MAFTSFFILSNSFVNQNYWNILSVGTYAFLSICDTRLVSSELQCRLCLTSLTTVVFAKLEELKLERRKFITVYSCASVQQRQSKSSQQRLFECKSRVILSNWTIFSWIKIKKRPPERELFLLQCVSTTVPVFWFVIVLSIFWPWCEAGLYVTDPKAVPFIQALYTSTAFIL